MTIKEFFSFQKNSFFWVNIIIMILVVCLAIAGVLYGLNKYTRHGQSVEVPNVKGMTTGQARNTLEQSKLKIEIIDSTYVKTLTPGSVLEQNPAQGMRVKEGRIVYLTTNTHSIPTIVVPDVADNSSFRQAQAKLSAMGFKLTKEEYVAGEPDWVYGVKYKGKELAPGEKIPMGATLTLMVGKGQPQPQDMSATSRPDNTQDNAIEDSWF